jgi:hypothetical protein
MLVDSGPSEGVVGLFVLGILFGNSGNHALVLRHEQIFPRSYVS